MDAKYFNPCGTAGKERNMNISRKEFVVDTIIGTVIGVVIFNAAVLFIQWLMN
jgi:hypothetical protein